MWRESAKLLLVALLAGLLGLWLGMRQGPTRLGALLDGGRAAGVSSPRIGRPVAPFRLRDLDGAAHQLPPANAQGLVLLNVWAPWCAPCVEEMPLLDRLARARAGRGLRVLGIALDEPAAVREFLRQVPVAYTILLDTPGPQDASVRLGNARGLLPYTVLLDARGRLLKQKLGPFTAAELEAWVQADTD